MKNISIPHAVMRYRLFGLTLGTALAIGSATGVAQTPGFSDFRRFGFRDLGPPHQQRSSADHTESGARTRAPGGIWAPAVGCNSAHARAHIDPSATFSQGMPL
jgi:hypothetical protein